VEFKLSTTFFFMKKFIYYWLPVFLWAGLIFYLSSVPNLNSGFAAFWDVFLRKLAHSTEFGILFLLVFWALRFGEGISFKKALLWSFAIAILYAFSDEFHQYFVAERQAKLMDVAVDSLGVILIGLLLLFCRVKNWRKITGHD
jgi:VanZ family protein